MIDATGVVSGGVFIFGVIKFTPWVSQTADRGANAGKATCPKRRPAPGATPATPSDVHLRAGVLELARPKRVRDIPERRDGARIFGHRCARKGQARIGQACRGSTCITWADAATPSAEQQ